jgi:mono/diheme cytochrome c family protein
MPAMQSLLSQDDRWAAIDYLRTFTYDPHLTEEPLFSEPAAATPPDNTEAAEECDIDQINLFAWDDAQAIQAGETLYQAQCVLCHGQDGSGGLPNTPDFTSPEVGIDLKAKPGHYQCAVSEGVGVMPAYGETLSEEERWQILTYLGSLGS